MANKISRNLDSEYFRAGEAADFLKISRTQFYRLKDAGHLPAPVRIGQRVVLYSRSSLERMLAGATA